ncbi:MAG: tetratricopeptide repeat protein [Chloroflexi bacterium]|nr:tetratricopeptide repeat protein [Chloroflexota bacterium]
MAEILGIAATVLGLVRGIWSFVNQIFGRSAGSPTNNQDEEFKTSWEGRPASLADHFVGRHDDVNEVAEAMNGSSVVAISGGAGTGKSRLAAEYTHQSGDGGFWTSAGGTAVQTLAALAPRLGIDAQGPNDEEIAVEAGRAVAAFPPGLVWVIDNLPEFGQVNDLLASAANLTLLITTRDSRRNLLPPTAVFLPLTLLEPEAAIDLLRSQGADKADETVLKEIADIVGYLPMGLEMLAARLGEPLADAASVLAELKEAPNPLLVKAFQDTAGQDLGKPVGVYSAITGTLNGLTQETRKAISPFGYLADEAVPLPLALALTGLDTNGLGQLLTECASQSILSVSQDELVVHALTAAAISVTNDSDALELAISSAIPRLSAIDTDDPVAMRAEISHHEALLSYAKKEKPSEDQDTLALSGNLATGYRSLGRTEEAVKLDEETLVAMMGVLGPEHPDTLNCRNNLAGGYWALGRTDEAVKLVEETLEAMSRVLGPEHPDTISIRGNLAVGYRALGRTEEAVELGEETLEARVRVLGPEHPDTLSSRSNLAGGYQALGRTEDSVKLVEEALEASVRVLGPEHPNTLGCRSNLATAYRVLGRTEEALKLDEETLEAMSRVLGPEHRDTLGSRSNLANGYLTLGRTEEAMGLYEETLEARVRVLGPDHPDTLSSRGNLANSYRALGRTEEAVKLGEETLEAMVRVLGPEHPNTLGGLRNLITAYRQAGRKADADTLAADERFPADT